jgi:hypothetical protein
LKLEVKVMHRAQSHAHHYVPEWYQRRFLPRGVSKYYYLDLQPETIVQNGHSHQRSAVRHLGPNNCFYKDNLYTLNFAGKTTDELEQFFFGSIDNLGAGALAAMANFQGITDQICEAFQPFVQYMGAQRFRTPRGLEEIKRRFSWDQENSTLYVLTSVFQSYATMWSEGVWEIARATQSPTKFLVTDNPVTFYCKVLFKGEWTYPNDPSLKQIGTRTIFPLGLDSCLIVTHLQLVRHLWSTPTEFRVNPRYYDQTMKHLGEIQYGRELDEDEVLRINYILKRRATRYVAAVDREWLYPERRVSTTEWSALDDDWFLLPHLWKVGFTGGIYAGGTNGPTFAADEYGRHPGQRRFQDKKQRDIEWFQHLRSREEWGKKRVGKSRAMTDERIGRHSVSDKMMDDFLREQGLLEPAKVETASEGNAL